MGDGFAICSIAEMNAGGGVGKFEDTLATRAAGVTRVAFQADNRDLGDAGFARSDHGGNRARFGAGACGIGSVLDIAAADNTARWRADGGTDGEFRIGCIGLFGGAVGNVKKGFQGIIHQRSFT